MHRSVVLAVVIALVAPTAAEARTSISKAPIRTVRAGQGTIGYRSVGRGRPLVLVMGLAGTMNAWEPSFVDALAAHHRVITFDNEGIGTSTLGTGMLTIRRMGRDTASLISSLRLRNPDVMGWSMGGMIAQALAHDRPRLVRRLILCATAPGDGKATFPSAGALSKLTGPAPDVGGLLGLLFPAGHQAATQRFIAGLSSYKEGAAVAPAAVVTQQLSASASWLSGHDPAGRPLRRLRLPVLVGAGALDQLLPVANDRHLAAALPDARLRVYPNAAHGFLFQDQANFLPAVISFLR
jgi:pimeloyl-ACP methyl ester carboxylesterase